MNITVLGIDLAKNVFQLHGIDDQNIPTCFYYVLNAEAALEKKIFSIQIKMWDKLYPPDVIKGVR